MYKKRLERRQEEALLEKLKSVKDFSHKAVPLALNSKVSATESSKEESWQSKPTEDRKRKFEGRQDENPAKKYKNTLFYNNPEIPKLSK